TLGEDLGQQSAHFITHVRKLTREIVQLPRIRSDVEQLLDIRSEETQVLPLAVANGDMASHSPDTRYVLHEHPPTLGLGLGPIQHAEQVSAQRFERPTMSRCCSQRRRSYIEARYG